MSQKLNENTVEETGKKKQEMQEKEGTLPERVEKAKLKAKYPSLGQSFLMKGLWKGKKYFDSGDYNMAKNKQLPSAQPDKNLMTGDHIPTTQDLKSAGGQVE
uniref:Alpha-endosulfine n=1 Tax=Mandrillus leucophaeus TaxID=9568 RepID=A0A2K5XKM0_MANLE